MPLSEDMRCLYCEGKLPLYKKITNGQFCSSAHRKAYWEEQERLAVERLHQTHHSLQTYRPAVPVEDILGPRATEPESTPLAGFLAECAGPFGFGIAGILGTDPLAYEAEPRVPLLPASEFRRDGAGIPIAAAVVMSAPGKAAPPRKLFETPGADLEPRDVPVLTAHPRDFYEICAAVPMARPLRIPRKARIALWTGARAPEIEPLAAQLPAPALKGIDLAPRNDEIESLLDNIAGPERALALPHPPPRAATPAALVKSLKPTAGRRSRPALPLDQPQSNAAPSLRGTSLHPLPGSSAAPSRRAWIENVFALDLATPRAPQFQLFLLKSPRSNPSQSGRKLVKGSLFAIPYRAGATAHPVWVQNLLPLSFSAPRAPQSRLRLPKPSRPEFKQDKGSVYALPLPRPEGLGSRSDFDGFGPLPSSSRNGAVYADALLQPAPPELPLAKGRRYAIALGRSAPKLPAVNPAIALASPVLPQRNAGIESCKLGGTGLASLAKLRASAKPAGSSPLIIVPALAGLPQPLRTEPLRPALKLDPLDAKSLPEKASLGTLVAGKFAAGKFGAGFWKQAPRDLKLLVFTIPILLGLAFHPGIPKLRVTAPTSAGNLGHSIESAVDTQLATLRQAVYQRAAVALDEDFRQGLDQWTNRGNAAAEWSFDQAGFVHPGPLALYRPSMGLTDYQMQFLGMIDKEALSWVIRAKDFDNFYVVKLKVLNPGPLPTIGITRYAVIQGKAQDRVDVKVPIQARRDTLYRVSMDVAGANFDLQVQGQIVDSWSEPRLPRGGIGFFTARGEESRVRWVQITHQYDMLGRLCAYLAPYDLSNSNRSWQ